MSLIAIQYRLVPEAPGCQADSYRSISRHVEVVLTIAACYGPSPNRCSNFFALNYVMGDKTLFRDVRLLTEGPITDDRLPELWSLNKCQWLDLSGTQITDAGLKHLEGLDNLQRLHLSGTKVTAEGVRKLQEALPNCEIHR